MKKIIFNLLAIILSTAPLATSQTKDEAAQQMQKFNLFYRYLTGVYLDELDTKPLVERAIREMLLELDPHSSYLTADELKSSKENMEGEFSGIGIEFSVQRDTIIVVNTIISAPAEAVGMRAGDRIIAIDGKSAIGFTQSDVPKHLKGKRGTKVKVEALRYGESEPLLFEITRDNIPITTIDAAYKYTPTIGYIKVGRFGMHTVKEMVENIEKLGAVESLILDLRGNGGGVMSEAIDMASYMLKKGSRILSIEGKAVGESLFKAEKDGKFLDGNLYVLLDEYSASASEIVAGAIQDWDRGIIIGQTSYGKGLVQRQYELGDGSAVRITIARYHTPSGRVIQRPYTMGESEAYFKHEGEDSVAIRPLFKTLRNGRNVYGGGGIEPDIKIAKDTTPLSPYYVELIRRGVISEFVLTYLDRHRDKILKRMPTFEQFNREFIVENKIVSEIIKLADGRDLKTQAPEIATLKEEIELYIKGLLVQKLYSTSSFFEVLNCADTAIFNVIDRLEHSPDERSKILGFQ